MIPGGDGGFAPGVWLALAAVWIGGSAASGLLAALVAGRLHGSLPFYRTWAFYSFLTALLVAVVLVIGVF